jgi:regulator of protease activity HflC (stomatin/prohibitin superfamily)
MSARGGSDATVAADGQACNIDAILFWQVHDPERAALEITDYRSAILRVAQTSLREMIGASCRVGRDRRLSVR